MSRPLGGGGGDASWRRSMPARLPAFLLAFATARIAMRSWAGTWLVFFPLVVTWVCDTAAMFGGRAMEGPKLAPTVSPGKTRSGGAAGVVGGLLVAPVFGLAVFPPWRVRVALAALLLMALVVVARGPGGRPGRIAVQARGRREGLEYAHPRAWRRARPIRLPLFRRPARRARHTVSAFFRHV